jgi:TolB-like protein/DNA-binding winged helix-turn-helix (wHTH) protein/Tfp pilus assembly protein PilF
MSESAHAPKVLRFGVFDVDMQAGELRKTGLRVKLQQQPFQLLVVLLERPGEVVTREELRQRLWPADTFVDFDLSLNSALKKLRYALGDVADSPTFIETIPRRGYRFIAAVRPVTVDFARSGPVQIDASSTDEKATRRVLAQMPGSARKGRSWRLATQVSLLALGIAAVMLVWRLTWQARSSGDIDSQASIQSLAVLPLENLSGDPSQDYFAEGMTDELITNLGQIGSLRVISRTSVMQYRGVHKPLPQIARELNVDAIVEGTVVRSGGQVRIAAQLIQAPVDKQLWAQSYQGDLKDVLGLQHEVANAIAKQIRMTLTPNEQIRVGIGRPLNPEAYEAYLRGEYFLNRFTSDSIRKAVDYFQLAIDKDPNYAPAYSKLAGCYQILGNMGTIPKKVAFPRAELFVAKALELDPQFGPAQAVQGWTLLQYKLDFTTAGAKFKRAVELNPNAVEGHEGLGDYYATMGRLQESVQEAERARELDPLATIVNYDLCGMLFFARRYDDALAQCKANLDLDPNSVRSLWLIGGIYAAKGMNSEAVSAFLQAMQLGGAPPGMIAAAKTGARDSGLKGFWKALTAFLPENVANGNLEPFDAAVSYANAGDNDLALRSLEKAVEARCYGITYLGVNPIFDDLRSDPRFVSLLRRIGLPQVKQKIGHGH